MSWLTDWLRTVTGTVAPLARRRELNAPCACGSGRKYKRCCLERRQPPDEELEARLSAEYSASNRDPDLFTSGAAARRGFRRWAELSRLAIRRRLRQRRAES